MQKPCLILVLVFLLPGLVFGQRTTTSISGNVTDPSGAVIPRANVEATEISTGTTTNGKANGDGFYILTNLSPGIYRLRVGQAGFEGCVRWNPWVPLQETTNNKLAVFSQAAYDQGLHSQRYPNAPPGLLYAGDRGIPITAVKASYRVFDPSRLLKNWIWQR